LSLHKKKANHNDGSHVTYGCMELDSLADTIVLGSNAIIVQYTNRECDVSPYAEDLYAPIVDVLIVTAVTSAQTGLTYILVFNKAILMGDLLDHCLLNPNQMRAYGITVQDNPYGDSAMHIATEQEDFRFPMAADGTHSNLRFSHSNQSQIGHVPPHHYVFLCRMESP
jgi:2-polyprenyl-6-methoxyphenol hydroxylase-like FAD-dependent oxidoreductase